MTQFTRRTLLAASGAAALTSSLSLRQARAQAANGSIRIGCTAPFSGVYATVGNPVKYGAQIAVDMLNAQGGIGGRKVELVVIDEKADPNQSVAAVREFAAQGVNLVIGEPNTANVLATLPVVKEANLVMIACGTPDERLTHDAFQPGLFTTSPNNYTTLRSYAKVLAQHYPDATHWTGTLVDISMAHNIWDIFAVLLPRAYESEAGKKITMMDPVLARFGSTDFKQAIGAMLAGPAEGLFNVEVGNDGLTFFQQQHQLGLDHKLKVMADYTLDLDLPKTLKKNLPPVIWSKSYFSYPAWESNKMAQAANAAYVKLSGDPFMHQLGCLGHTAILGLAAAISATGGKTDTASVIAGLESTKFDTIRGEVAFRKADHQLISSINFCRFEPADTEIGWKYADLSTVPDAANINPPAPGEKFVIPA